MKSLNKAIKKSKKLSIKEKKYIVIFIRPASIEKQGDQTYNIQTATTIKLKSNHKKKTIKKQDH